MDSPFFIMGCRRSGTTLVSQMLDSHSRLAVYHESYYYPIFRPELRWYGDLGDPRCLDRLIADVQEIITLQRVEPPPARAIRAAMLSPTFESLLVALLSLYAASKGKVRGGDKTPEHHLFLSEIQSRLPDCPVIYLMRDPRDTVLSIRKAFDIPIEDGARSWNAAVLSLQGASRPVHLVRYEQLVTAPESEVRAICAALGEEYQPELMSFHERVPDSFRGRKGGEKIDKPVDAGSVGGWRSMSADEIARVESLCGEGMEAMGYPFSGPRPATVVPLRSAVARPRRALPLLLMERLRYYGTNRERWRRGAARWRLLIRVRASYLMRALAGGKPTRG